MNAQLLQETDANGRNRRVAIDWEAALERGLEAEAEVEAEATESEGLERCMRLKGRVQPRRRTTIRST